MMFKTLFLCFFIVCVACQPRHTPLTPELQKVIDHYNQLSADKLKLKAAWFLIDNMDAHYTEDSKELRQFYTFMDSIYALDKNFAQYDSIYKAYLAQYPYIELHTYPDKQYIKADYLIANIDRAFAHWQSSWTKHLTFDQFCEYILPYRLADEVLEPWWTMYHKRYQHVFQPADYDTLTTLEVGCKKCLIL